MSLEQALAENTAAIKELAAVWAKLNAQANVVDKMPADTVVKAGTATVAAKPEKAAAAPKAEKPAATPAATSTIASTASSSKPAESPAVDYAPVGAAITAYAAANGRDATIAKLGEFGVSSGKALKPEQYEAALAAFTAEEEEVA